MLSVAGGILLAVFVLWAIQAIRSYDWARDVSWVTATFVIGGLLAVVFGLPLWLAISGR